MRIRMTTAMPEGATRDGVPWPAVGEEWDLPSSEAAHLVASGVAEDADAPARTGGRRKTAAKEVTGSGDGPDS
ncbi:hypothetical protein [Streptomyces erythrochromogenes]|uniref:hypothetical protein n=1 Tax=Streptomyces erythrochromogenes TaxID=285574 RepID=UPI00368D1891